MEGWGWRLRAVGLGRRLRMVLLRRLCGWRGWGLRSFGRVGRGFDVGWGGEMVLKKPFDDGAG
jgi:hypothetical protein